jgi:hypothetical protein
MSIIRTEEFKYHIIYINKNERYRAYKRINSSDWLIYEDGRWQSLSSRECLELEKEFNEYQKSK